MPWQPALNSLRDILADLYPDVADVRRVAADAALPLGRVALQGKPVNDWQAALEEAEKRGQVESILQVAAAEYPTYAPLVEAAEAYRRGSPQAPRQAGAPALPAPLLNSRNLIILVLALLGVAALILFLSRSPRWSGSFLSTPTSPPAASPAAGATTPSPSAPAPAATRAAPSPAPSATAPGPAGPLVLDLGGGVTMELVRVPAGEFLMGSSDKDPLAAKDEKPQHRLALPEYLIGKYEVTRAQYRAFVQAAHYERAAPGSVGSAADYPVDEISWHDAIAFCEWASAVSGRTVRLPSEAEWEKAARGTEGRIYPWGNLWEPWLSNNVDFRPRGLTPVGFFSPQGDSPYGAADMAGNVMEWTRSLWGRDKETPEFGYPYDPTDGRENLGAGDDVLRVVRGGNYLDFGEEGVRSAFRTWVSTELAFESVGFRVVVLPP